MDKVKWVYVGDSVKEMKRYHLANDLYDKYKDKELRKTDPDYVPGIEWEPYMLYIFQTGFEDLYHCVIETGEIENGNYYCLTSKEINIKYKINIHDERNTHKLD